MTDRRRHSRFLVDGGWEGHLHVVEAVTIEESSDGKLSALSTSPAVRGEVMKLEMSGQEPATLSVRVLDSQPAAFNGSIRHRLNLEIVDAQTGQVAKAATGPSGAEV